MDIMSMLRCICPSQAIRLTHASPTLHTHTPCRSDLAARQGDLEEAKAQLVELNTQLADVLSDKDALLILHDQSKADVEGLRAEAGRLRDASQQQEGRRAELEAQVQVGAMCDWT